MKIWGLRSLLSLSAVCSSIVDIEQRFSFENPMQAIDAFPRKMHLAKYRSTILQRFQESLVRGPQTF